MKKIYTSFCGTTDKALPARNPTCAGKQQRLGQALKVGARRRNRAAQAKSGIRTLSTASEGALRDPAPGQQHEAPLGLGQLDHLELDALLVGRLGGFVAGVALVHSGQREALPGRLLHPCGQFADLRPLLRVGGRDRQRQQQARSDEQQAKGLPPLPAIATLPGMARWKALHAQASAALDTMQAEMQDYFDVRTEAWQQSDKGAAFQEMLDQMEQARSAVDGLTLE